jgi:hypothetical protein
MFQNKRCRLKACVDSKLINICLKGGNVVVKALRYKPEGHSFEIR